MKQYQQAQGLSVDGIVGVNTWGALTGGGGAGNAGNAGAAPSGYSVSGVTGQPSFTFTDLQAQLDLSRYQPRSEAQLLAEAQNRYDPIFNADKQSTQQAYDRILLALDQQMAGLQPAYDKQRSATAEAFAGAYSQADRQALSRGMQRSSYNAQTLSNIGIKGAKAQDDINAAQRMDETNIGQNRALQTEQYAQNMRRLETDYWTNVSAYQDQLRNLDYDRAWQSQQAANQTLLSLYQLSLQQYQFEAQMAENARQFNASLTASKSTGSGGGSSGGGTTAAKTPTTSTATPSSVDTLLNLTSGTQKSTGGNSDLLNALLIGAYASTMNMKPKAATGTGGNYR